MEDIFNMIVGLIGAFIVGMAFHSTLAHYLPDKKKSEGVDNK